MIDPFEATGWMAAGKFRPRLASAGARAPAEGSGEELALRKVHYGQERNKASVERALA